MKNRRQWLRQAAGGWATAMILPGLATAQEAATNTPVSRDRLGDLLPQRPLGKTGTKVTILCVGGAHVGGFTVKEERGAQQIIEAALEGGVRFFETAETYLKGESERRFGRLLTPKYRDVIFLATKTTAPDAKTARQHLDGSLARMNTDYLDLWQIHQVADPDDVDKRLDNGVLDVLVEAREKGKVRHIGFTGHRDYRAHLHMFEKTKALETCQMPINVLDPGYKSFITNVLPVLLERDMGILGMKTLAFGSFFKPLPTQGSETTSVIPDRLTVAEALSFVWSLPISARVAGVDNVEQIREQIDLAISFTQFDEAERRRLVEKVSDLSGTQREGYKS